MGAKRDTTSCGPKHPLREPLEKPMDDVMEDKPIDLDDRRGLVSQHATDLRRLTALVEADRKALDKRQEELERYLVTLPAHSWEEAADKARYLLGLLKATS